MHVYVLLRGHGLHTNPNWVYRFRPPPGELPGIPHENEVDRER